MSLGTFLKEWGQPLLWLVGIGGGLIGAFKAIRELRLARRQREEELRWRKANLARECLDAITANVACRGAMRMLDWSGRLYEVRAEHPETVNWDEMNLALRPDAGHFSEKEVYIRDAFDAFFDSLERLEHYVRIGIIQFDDVRDPLEYYVERLGKRAANAGVFLEKFGYRNAAAFVDRFSTQKAG